MSLIINMLIVYFIGLIAGGLLGAKIMRLFWLSKHPEDRMIGETVTGLELDGSGSIYGTAINCDFQNNRSTGYPARGTPDSEGGG